MTRAVAAVVILAWLANQAIHLLLHPTTTPEEGNHA